MTEYYKALAMALGHGGNAMITAIIRLLDMAESRGWDMEAAILLKHHYNLGRPYRHGGKLA